MARKVAHHLWCQPRAQLGSHGQSCALSGDLPLWPLETHQPLWRLGSATARLLGGKWYSLFSPGVGMVVWGSGGAGWRGKRGSARYSALLRCYISIDRLTFPQEEVWGGISQLQGSKELPGEPPSPPRGFVAPEFQRGVRWGGGRNKPLYSIVTWSPLQKVSSGKCVEDSELRGASIVQKSETEGKGRGSEKRTLNYL